MLTKNSKVVLMPNGLVRLGSPQTGVIIGSWRIPDTRYGSWWARTHKMPDNEECGFPSKAAVREWFERLVKNGLGGNEADRR